MGGVVHFEIPADDMDRAQQFYKSAFGWQISSIPDINYAMVTTTDVDEQSRPKEPGAINGGMFKRDGDVTNPTIVVDVEDIDETLKTLEGLGATTLSPKQPVMDMGFSAYFRDPEGNIIGLWETAKPS
jgi:predicted enzyme related to lactoylglutathione lyase